ncbi:MAG: hypothetical protein JWM56_718 [Candidatus Peribacteria bacterium]|nr:hypothetical protein [Candidatus Peribacteria bacterium]
MNVEQARAGGSGFKTSLRCVMSKNLYGLSVKKQQEGWKKLARFVDQDWWLRMIAADDAAMKQLAVSLVPISDPILDTAVQSRARAIMGKNFLGLEEVRRGYGIALDSEPLAEIPFSEETLQACKDTHVLVAGSALSVNEIRKIADSDFYDTDWYKREPFANDKKVSVRWYLLRSAPVPESRNKTYDQQCSLLTKEEEVPFACEMTYMVILYWRVYCERLLPDVYVRCQDKDSISYRIVVGNFDSGGFDVVRYWDDVRFDACGLASSVPPLPARP